VLTAATLFSGIGCGDLALRRAGFALRWGCEIDPFCRRVFEARFPGVPLYGDIRHLDAKGLEPVDVLVAGWPCQDLSVAGRRSGLAGERSGLFFDLCRILATVRPHFAVLENVPGLLSSNGGRDFAVVLSTLAQSGALDICWRVLDAQWFGVPQRRRRVFLVVDFAGERAAEVLFEPEGGGWHPAPRRAPGARVAASLTSGAGSPSKQPAGRRKEDDVNLAVAGALTASDGGPDDNDREHLVVARTLTAPASPRYDGDTENFVVADPLTASYAKHGGASGGKDSAARNIVLAPTLRTNPRNNSNGGSEAQMLVAHALTAEAHDLRNGMTVRRLTPVEAERLMGLPDNWTAIDGDRTPASPRYRALGNGMAVPVIEWILRRILAASRAAHEAAVRAQAREDVRRDPKGVIDWLLSRGRTG
jgi:DNA (cytosine-5)-methyltransferase 1